MAAHRRFTLATDINPGAIGKMGQGRISGA